MYKMEKTYIIYKHTNKINGKVYIGQTCQNPKKRWDYGCGYKKHNLYFYNAIKKYGWTQGFDHEILETGLSLEQANEREQYWIRFYNSLTPNGYNLTIGGDGGQGHTLSEETKKLIGQKNSRPVRCLELDIVFESATLAAKMLGFTPGHIGDVCNQKRTEAGGMHWEYIDSPLPGNTNEEKITYLQNRKGQSRKKPVLCIETNLIYESGTKAAEECHISKGNLSACLNGKRPTAGGFHWKFYNEEKHD